MTELEELIQYWKDRVSSTPSHTIGRDREAIRETIKYLEELKKIKEGD